MESFKKWLRTQIRAYYEQRAKEREEHMWVLKENPKTLGTSIKEDTFYGRF